LPLHRHPNTRLRELSRFEIDSRVEGLMIGEGLRDRSLFAVPLADLKQPLVYGAWPMQALVRSHDSRCFLRPHRAV
jgi:hypothetical protein